MNCDLSGNEIIIYNLIKKAICQYIFTPLKCCQEDVILLAKTLNSLINNNNNNYDNWCNLFKVYLKIESTGELKNLASYVQNNFIQ